MNVTRIIGACEYNAAVVRCPAACPLFIAGDLRSGHQVALPARPRTIARAHALLRRSRAGTMAPAHAYHARTIGDKLSHYIVYSLMIIILV